MAQRVLRFGLLVAVAGLVGAACSSGGSDEAASTVAPSDSASAPGVSDPVFTPTDDSVVTGTVVLDDDVIIATDDGEIPTPTTELQPSTVPVEPLPVDAATTTTAEPVPLPEPASVGRIVSLSATHTETLFALGLGEFVVAVDADSRFPSEAESLRRDELSAENADLGPLLALEPDVVVLGEDPTGMAGRLSEAGVASFSGPPAQSLDEVYSQIVGVASIVGRPDLGDDLVASMRSEIAAIVDALPPSSGRTFFHEVDPTLVTITGDGFLPSIYGAVGLTNIMDTSAGADFGQASNAQVIEADPDVILLADAGCCRVSIDVISQRDGWAGLSAVQSGAVVPLDDALVARWGPSVVELVRSIAGGVAAAG